MILKKGVSVFCIGWRLNKYEMVLEKREKTDRDEIKEQHKGQRREEDGGGRMGETDR